MFIGAAGFWGILFWAFAFCEGLELTLADGVVDFVGDTIAFLGEGSILVNYCP